MDGSSPDVSDDALVAELLGGAMTVIFSGCSLMDCHVRRKVSASASVPVQITRSGTSVRTVGADSDSSLTEVSRQPANTATPAADVQPNHCRRCNTEGWPRLGSLDWLEGEMSPLWFGPPSANEAVGDASRSADSIFARRVFADIVGARGTSF